MTVAVEHLGAKYFQDPFSVHGFGSMRLAVPAESLRWRPSTLIYGLESPVNHPSGAMARPRFAGNPGSR